MGWVDGVRVHPSQSQDLINRSGGAGFDPDWEFIVSIIRLCLLADV